MYSGAFTLSQSDIISTGNRFVRDDSVVPKRYGAWCPLPADSKIICVEQMFAKEVKNVIRFLAVKFFDALNE